MNIKEEDLHKHSAIVLHCSATKPSMDIGVDEIRSWHLQRNFNDIGYHLVIRRDGSLERGRPWDKQGAHAYGFNRNTDGKLTFGICMVGGVAEHDVNVVEDNFTKRQWETLNTVLKNIIDYSRIKEVYGHNELNGHESRGCPSFNSKAYTKWLYKSINTLYLPDNWYTYDWHEAVPNAWDLPNTFMDEVDTGESNDK